MVEAGQAYREYLQDEGRPEADVEEVEEEEILEVDEESELDEEDILTFNETPNQEYYPV